MQPDEPETRSFTVPALDEEQAEPASAPPHYFGVTPSGFAAVLAAFAFGAAIVLLVAGLTLVGVLLLVAAVLLAAVFVEQALRRRETPVDRAAAAAVDQTRALAGYTGVSVRSWTGTSRQLVHLRLEANKLARRRARLQYAFGGAVYAGDADEAERLRAAIASVDARFAACVKEANEAVERLRTSHAQERLAVAPTRVDEPGGTP